MQEKTIKAFQQGDKESYRLIFDMLYSTMCLFATKFINDYNESEDITQEVFIELWHQKGKFESIDHIKAFIYTSIKNRCINFNRHIKIREKYSQIILEDNEVFFEEAVIETEVIQNLNNAINKLPVQRKQIIKLCLQGLKNEEIADNMDISINTVKQQKKIAYKQLREKLSLIFILF